MSGRGVNKVILIGNLGSDPETRYTQGGSAVTNLSIATSERWKDKQSGEDREQTEWHRVVMFARLAEIAAEYLRKGSKVYVEGRIQTRKWQGQDGQDRYTTEIVGNEMQMLDSRGDGGGGGDGRATPGRAAPGNTDSGEYRQASGGSRQRPLTPQGAPPAPGVDPEDDIPF